MPSVIWHLTLNPKHLLNLSVTCPASDVAKLKDKEGSIHHLATNKVIILNKFNQISLKTNAYDRFSGQIKEKSH